MQELVCTLQVMHVKPAVANLQPHNPALLARPPQPTHLQLSALRHGNIPLALSGHVLVCNWNRQAPLLLRQMASGGHGDSRTLGRQAGRHRWAGQYSLHSSVMHSGGCSQLSTRSCRHPQPPNVPIVCRDIVVLADVPKRELDEEMQRTLHGTRLHWVTRCGVEWNVVEQPQAGSKTGRRAMHCALTFSACDSLANGAMPRLPCLLCQAWGASLGKRFGDCGRSARQDRHPAAPR